MRASSVTARLRTVLPVKDWAWWRLPWLLRIYIGAVPAAALALIALAGASTTWTLGDLVKFLLLLGCGVISVVATPRLSYLGAGVMRDFLTAWVLAGAAFLAYRFYQGSFLISALVTGWILWLSFTVARMLVHDLLDTRTLKLTALTALNEFITVTAMGLIIGLWPPPGT